jgi:hypothetical protein
MSKNTAKERILRYLTKADITLNSEEELILKRWESVDHLMRAKMAYADIILKHTGRFNISKFTADLDISNAQEIFARSRKLNKRYLAHLHLEDIQQDLKNARAKIMTHEYIDAKELTALAQLYNAYTKLLQALPDDQNIVDPAKPVIVFELLSLPGQAQLLDIKTAILEADKLLGHHTEDIAHEIVPPNDSPTE